MFGARARRWLARSAVAVAAATAVSVGVTSSAQAFIPPPPVPPIVAGPVAGAIAPAVTACAVSVVCAAGVGLVVAGTAAWATRDTWVPWLQGLIPGSSDQGPSTAGRSIVLGAISVTGSTWAMGAYNTRTTGFGDDGLQIAIDQVCQSGSAFAATTASWNETFQKGATYTYQGACAAGTTPVFIMIRPGGTQQHLWPANWPKYVAGGAAEAVEKASTYKVTVSCVVAAGDPTTTADDTFQELVVEYSGVSGGFVYPSCAGAGIGTGQGSKVRVDQRLPGGSSFQTVWDAKPPANLEYPNCGNTMCKMELYYNDQPCQVGASACLDWMRRVQREGSTDYECRYGPYVVPMVRCDVLERTYQPGGARLDQKNTDGDPDTWTNPDGTPGTTPGTGGTPGTGTGGGPVTVAPVPTPVTDSAAEPSNDSCFPSGTAAFNPVEWVLRPVKCALWWAFVPAGVGESVTDWWDVNKSNLGGTPLGAWWSSFGAWGTAFAAAGGGTAGCQGPGLPTGFLGARGVMPAVIHPWDACSGPKAIAAATVHGLLTVSIAFFSGWRIVRIVGKPFGYDLDLMNGRGEGSK